MIEKVLTGRITNRPVQNGAGYCQRAKLLIDGIEHQQSCSAGVSASFQFLLVYPRLILGAQAHCLEGFVDVKVEYFGVYAMQKANEGY